jgi:hypothetical protein
MRRPVLLAAALAGAALVTPAHAARRPPPKPQKPFCRLVVDPEGDAKGLYGPATNPEGDTGLDVIGADFANNAGKATVVFRLPGANNNDPLSPAGRYFALTYSVGGRKTTLAAVITPRGNVWGAGDPSTVGVVDTKVGEIRMTVPLAEAGLAGVAPGTAVTGFSVVTKRWAGAGTTGQPVDEPVDSAAGTATYKAAGASCVKVGADVAGA